MRLFCTFFRILSSWDHLQRGLPRVIWTRQRHPHQRHPRQSNRRCQFRLRHRLHLPRRLLASAEMEDLDRMGDWMALVVVQGQAVALAVTGVSWLLNSLGLVRVQGRAVASAVTAVSGLLNGLGLVGVQAPAVA